MNVPLSHVLSTPQSFSIQARYFDGPLLAVASLLQGLIEYDVMVFRPLFLESPDFLLAYDALYQPQAYLLFPYISLNQWQSFAQQSTFSSYYVQHFMTEDGWMTLLSPAKESWESLEAFWIESMERNLHIWDAAPDDSQVAKYVRQVSDFQGLWDVVLDGIEPSSSWENTLHQLRYVRIEIKEDM